MGVPMGKNASMFRGLLIRGAYFISGGGGVFTERNIEPVSS